LDEVIHHSGGKWVQVHQIVAIYWDFMRHGKTKNTAASWVFAFTAHTLTATDWLAALIDASVIFTGFLSV
jgi:hypothetical protein